MGAGRSPFPLPHNHAIPLPLSSPEQTQTCPASAQLRDEGGAIILGNLHVLLWRAWAGFLGVGRWGGIPFSKVERKWFVFFQWSSFWTVGPCLQTMLPSVKSCVECWPGRVMAWIASLGSGRKQMLALKLKRADWNWVTVVCWAWEHVEGPGAGSLWGHWTFTFRGWLSWTLWWCSCSRDEDWKICVIVYCLHFLLSAKL